jgi:hypothetical protein
MQNLQINTFIYLFCKVFQKNSHIWMIRRSSSLLWVCSQFFAMSEYEILKSFNLVTEPDKSRPVFVHALKRCPRVRLPE